MDPNSSSCLNAPLRFTPFLRPLAWGGRRLRTVLGKPLPDDAAYGESWEISDHHSHSSVLDSGPGAGMTLRELLDKHLGAIVERNLFRSSSVPLVENGTSSVLRPAIGRFPWLIKHLDVDDWLSVQVHPDDVRARRWAPAEGGKSEVWFILDASPSSRVYAGLLPGVGESDLRAALAKGNVVDCLASFVPQPGDCVYLPAGTVHAAGGGVLIAEVQQTSDATFRLFDWNRRDAQGRSRALHIEESLACINWDSRIAPTRATGARGRLVDCPHFTLDYVQSSEALVIGGTGRMEVMIVVQGQGTVASVDPPMKIKRGDALLLPAVMPGHRIEPDGSVELLLVGQPRAQGSQ